MNVSVEVTVRRVSPGTEDVRWVSAAFGPRIDLLQTALSQQSVSLGGVEVPADMAFLEIRDLAPVDADGWLGGLMMLTVNNGHVGSRPFLVYDRPFDIPVYTTFRSPYYGTWVVGMRSAR